MQEPTQPERLGFGIRWEIYEPQRLWASETSAFLGTRFLPCLGVSVVNYSGRIPITAIILPVLPNSARCEKKRLVSHAVQPSMMEMCSGPTPAASS